MSETVIRSRIDSSIKLEAQALLGRFGLTMSEAIRLFLHQVVIEQGIPFKPTRTPREIREEYDNEAQWALQHGKRYVNAREMCAGIMKKKE